jgi:malate dehydrogenase (oxaloacetate-decarboxylating)(NADP+)
MSEQLAREALDYHRQPRPGKVEVRPTKPHATQHDLTLAYSPGVATPWKSRGTVSLPMTIRSRATWWP